MHASCAHHQRPTAPNEIVLCDTAWWIVARGRVQGPFDYQWTSDLKGIEFLYRGVKFGEVCSEDELYADLSPFGLPISVCRVCAVVAGTLAMSLAALEDTETRTVRLTKALDEFGFSRFRVRRADSPDRPAG